MNNVFTAKLIQNLQAKKKANQGFTLIELLVVVIIIGVLAAVALPNLLAQVGKARESEGKTAVGTLNRGQQAYHFEATQFVPNALVTADLAAITNPLGVAIASDYYTFDVNAGTAAGATQTATAIDAPGDGVREYAGAIVFDAATGGYDTALCQGASVGTAPTADDTVATDATCTAGTELN